MRTALIIAVALAFLGICGVAVGADPAETELKFAIGLRDLGYYELAIGQFKKLDWPQQKNAAFRTRVAEGLIETHMMASRTAGTPEAALHHLGQAEAQLAQLGQARMSDIRRNRMLMRHGRLLLERGLLAREVHRRKSRGTDPAKAAAESEAAFTGALDAFQKAVNGYQEIVERIEARNRVTDKDRRARRQALNLQIAAETQTGWSRYELAGLYEQQKKEDAAKQEIAAAAKMFKTLSARHKNIVAGLSATLGHALCLQKLGKHKEAVAVFDDVYVLSKPPKELTPILYQAQYEKAASQAALGRYDHALKTLEQARKQYPRALRSEQEQEWLFRYANLTVQSAKAMQAEAKDRMSEADQLAVKGSAKARARVRQLKQGAAARSREARKRYARAVKDIRKLIAPGGIYEEEATLLFGQWAATGGIEQQLTAGDFYAAAERHLAASNGAEAVAGYRLVISSCDPRNAADGRLRRDAWVHMAQAYVQMKQHYEAGLVLGHAARLFPDNPKTEKVAIYSAMLLGAAYEEGRTPFEADTYLQSQELLVTRYGHTPEAERAAFRLGDVRRDRGECEAAASFYGKVGKASAYYERSRYLAGWCLWQAVLKDPAAAKVHGATAVAAHLRSFVKWAETQPAGSQETQQARELWAVKSRVLLAEVLLRQGQARESLQVLDDAAFVRVRRLSATDQRLLSRARLYRFTAWCTLGAADDLRKAALEMPDLRNDKQIAMEKRSAAARLIGMTYLKLAGKAAKAKSVPAGVLDPEITPLLESARRFLLMSLDLNTDRDVAGYQEIATALYHAGAYAQAAGVFELLYARIRNDPAQKELARDVCLWTGKCHQQAGELVKATAVFEALIKELPDWIEVRRDLALCYGNPTLQRYAEAAKHWQKIKRAFAMHEPQWFEAQYHQIEALTKQGRRSLAFQMLAAVAVSHADLGGPPWKDNILQLVESEFSDSQKRTFNNLREQAVPQRN